MLQILSPISSVLPVVLTRLAAHKDYTLGAKFKKSMLHPYLDKFLMQLFSKSL